MKFHFHILRKVLLLAGIVALATSSLLIFAPAQGSKPEILSIDFPQQILADGSENIGYVFFKDPDGDIIKATFDVVKAVDFQSFSIDPKVKGQKEGAFQFIIATKTPQQVTLKVTLTDEAGNESEPKEFSFEAIAVGPPPPPPSLFGYIVGESILHIVDLSANRVIESITAPFDSPGDAEFSLDNTILYIINSSRRKEGEIFPFNIKDKTFAESIKVGGRPNDLEISPAGDLAYLNNFGLHEVQVIDLKTNRVKSTIPIDGTPNELALSPDGTKAYVTAFNYDEEPPLTPAPLFILDLTQEKIIGSIPLEFEGELYASSSVDVAPDGKFIYVLAVDSSTETEWAIFIIDAQTNQIAETVPLDVSIANVLVIAPDGQSAYVSAFYDGVVAIDPKNPKAAQAIKLEGERLALASTVTFSPDSNIVYIVGVDDPRRRFSGPGFVAAIDTRTAQQMDLDGDPANGITNIDLGKQPIFYWMYMAIPG